MENSSGMYNGAGDFLSRPTNYDGLILSDEGDRVEFVFLSDLQEGVEKEHRDTLSYLCGNEIESVNKSYLLKVSRGSKKFLS